MALVFHLHRVVDYLLTIAYVSSIFSAKKGILSKISKRSNPMKKIILLALLALLIPTKTTATEQQPPPANSA